MMNRTLRLSGQLSARRIRTSRPPLSWKLRNNLRWGFIKGWIAARFIVPFANTWGVATMLADLRLTHIQGDGTVIDYGIVCRRVITDAGVAFLVDDWDANGQDISTMNFHGCGTGTNAENATDTQLQTESTTILNPDSTRATGVRSQPTAPQYRSVGTVAFDGSGAITEHGILSQAATGGGSLWDRSVFSAINVVSGDSIVFTYTVTISSGG